MTTTNDERAFITELHCDVSDIHDLADSLVRAMESNHDLHDISQPDLPLAKLLVKTIGNLTEKIGTHA